MVMIHFNLSQGSKDSVFNNKYWSSIQFEELQEKSSCKGIADSTKPPNDDDFDCQVDETVDASAILIYRDGILGYVS
ncbi:hypothetical protein C5167_036331, partial [Papaver somniferum]